MMKLKTKFQDEDFELGEVVEADIFYGGLDIGIKVETRTAKGNYHTFYCASLKELNNLFEDYEGPKGIVKVEKSIIPTCVHIECSTKEEAELAVRKLKAWKRLKDNGFKFDGWTIDDGLRISICTNMGCGGIYDDDKKEMKSYLDSLFGGEE